MRSMNSTDTPDEATTPVIEQVRNFLTRFVAFPHEAQADVIALWVLHTWVFDIAYNTPYLYVTSAGPQSGKTRTIEAAELLCRNAISAASMTASAMFRAIDPTDKTAVAMEDLGFAPAPERVKPTLFVDEADAVFTGSTNEELRGVLNSGYKHNGATMRTVGGDVERFSTFCPKLLAGIDNGHLPDTIADRSITILLRRKEAGELTIERFQLRKVEAEAKKITAAISEWAKETGRLTRLADAEPDFIDGLSDRAFDIAEPLINIADEFGDEWGKRGRDSLTELLSGNRVRDTPLTQVLRAATEWIKENGEDFIPSATLEKITGIPSRRIGHLLKPYGATSSVTTVRLPGGVKKNIRGYHYHKITAIMEEI